MDKRIGFIGLGIMGRPMARNLLKAGYSLTVYSRGQSAVEALIADGAVGVRSSQEVAERSDVVITMVTDTPDVRQVLLADKGVLAGIRTGGILIDMSTISPQVTRELADEAKSKGILWLDGPVSGGEKGAIEGTLTIMVGGDPEGLEKARPVLNSMGKRITHFGPAGSGQSAKLCNQIMTAINMLAVCEALTFGAKAGLDLATLHQALTGGAANSWALEVLGKKMIERDFKPAFMVRLQQKDLRLVMDAANLNHTPLPTASLAHQLFAVVEAEGRGDDGTQSLLRIFERLAGL